jgi:hypothetical protein
VCTHRHRFGGADHGTPADSQQTVNPRPVSRGRCLIGAFLWNVFADIGEPANYPLSQRFHQFIG